MAHQTISPTKWTYAQIPSASLPSLSDKEWTKCTQFPTEIHLELREAGKIGDWNKGRVEHDVQWVCKEHWAFRSEINVDENQLKGMGYAELEFEGLDTFATVYLNGRQLLETDNHFTIHTVQVPVKDLQSSNELVITFKPPEPVAQDLAQKYGPFRGGSCNLGTRDRMAIRKSQYHFRWDWGPELQCIGPDRPIHLHLYSSRIKEVHTCARVDEELKRSLKVEIETEGRDKVVRMELSTLDGKVIKTQDTKIVKSEITIGAVEWDLGEEVELWWPVRQGKQTRYQVKVELLSESGEVIDTLTRKIGFRRMQLIQRPLDGQEGTSFFFQVNNKPVFCAGSNWIPIDNTLPSGTDERYRKWMEMLVKGNQNMVRIWGGGVFEPDIFYDLCDELGILVWQDFMFACGVYPIFPEFMDSVKKEAECNVKRLRSHPSMAVFCGNNEDYQMILQWDIDQEGDPLPARKIYEHLLPEVVTRLTDPEVPYHRGSPYGGKGWDTADPTIGDVHQWDVWGGKEKYYQDWDILGGRFVSEFGIPALPDIRTIDFWLDGDTAQRYPQSRLMQQHNKAGSHERRLAIYMNENFRYAEDLERYAFLTRLMQSDAVGLSYELWRRAWQGPKKEYCAGVLVWQLNDCWPVTSWAIIDYFYRPKPAYFAIARASAPLSVGLRRTVAKNRENDRPRTFYEYGAFQSRKVTVELWASNFGAATKGKIEVHATDICTGWQSKTQTYAVDLAENQSTEIWKGDCPAPPTEEAYDKYAPSGSVVLHANLRTDDGTVSRISNWPEPYKFLSLPDPALTVKVEGDEISVSCEKPCKGVWLDLEGDNDGLEWSDNGFDVFPGDEQRVRVKGLSGRKVTVAYLGKEKPTAV